MIFTDHTYPFGNMPNKMYNHKQKDLEIIALKKSKQKNVLLKFFLRNFDLILYE